MKKYSKVIVFLTSLVLIVGFLLMSGNSAYASPNVGGVSMEPVARAEDTAVRHSFRYVLAEGEELRDAVVVRSTKDSAAVIMLFSSGYNFKDGKLIKLEYEPGDRQDPGYWVEFDEQEIPVSPHGSKTVGFTVRVPEYADVGEHTGVILVSEKKSASKNKGGMGLSIVMQVGAQIVVNVPGDVERSLVINSVTHSIDRSDNRALKFHFNASNGGNVTLRPRLDAVIRGLFGKVGEMKDVEMSPLLRESTGELMLPWNKRAPYIGRFVASFKFHLGEHTQYNRDGTTTLLPDETVEVTYVFWIIPGAEILYVVLLIIFLYLLRSLWLYLVISRRLRTKTKIYKVVKNDTLTGIAAKFGIDPRVLAKFNMMRWPYEVHPGDQLLIPIGRMERKEWKERSRTMLGDREIVGGILGHLFRWRGVHHITSKLMKQDTERLSDDMEILIAEKGDTITDVAEFAGIGLDELISLNNLRPPYRLRNGQELIVPKKKPRKKAKKTHKKRRGK